MATLPVKINNKDILTFDLDNQEVIYNYLNNTKGSEVPNSPANGLCGTQQCYNCNQKHCNQIRCSNVQCSQVQCNQVHCNQIHCSDCTTIDCTELNCKNCRRCDCNCSDSD